MTSAYATSNDPIVSEFRPYLDYGDAATFDQSSLSAEETKLQIEAWQQIIDDILVPWGQDPAHVDEDGYELPSLASVGKSIGLAQELARFGCPAPTNVVSDGNGGISMKWIFPDGANVLDIHESGDVKYKKFLGTRLVASGRIKVSSATR